MKNAKNENKQIKQKEAVKFDGQFTVMPQEFRKAPVKKKISTKFFIFGGAGLGIIAISVIAVLVFMNQPNKIVVAPTLPEEEVIEEEIKEPEKETPTTTEEESLLFPVVPTSTEEEAPKPIISPEDLVQGTDSDADGLTEKEEAIFQTDTTRPDTDADGFLDGNEVFHLYNPSAIAPAGLLESGIAKFYRNATEGFSIFYPALWSTSSTSDMSRISFLSEGTESINITVEQAAEGITLRSWYITEYPEADINQLQSYTNKQGYSGLQDKNRLNTYIKEGGKVFIVNYSLGGTNMVWYRRLYDMMLNSLKIE